MKASMMTSDVALKEWAVVVQAMAEGRQILLLRKGGIRDPKGAFQLEHREFFLYPTWEHQRESPECRVRPEFRERYKELFTQPPAPQSVPLKVYAGVAYCAQVQDPQRIAGLEKFHIWTPEFIQERMRYRPISPMLAVVLRAYRLKKEIVHPVRPEYAGCKSWVPLSTPVPIEGTVPVVDNQPFRQALEEITGRLEG
ncbi:MAG: DUF1802 family protein [Candidatus Omnitrophica bacterium]|nr:DUF1802 family protein [Candidatus Omnitrophota bacterium]